MYSQKKKYDEKCVESRLPKETMEQYMYSYLNKRYGLKSLVLEWASAVIIGVKKYSHEDSEIELFGKILKNECDEDFRFVYNEVKTAILDILEEKLKMKFKRKTDTEIKKLVNNIVTGDIEESLWKELLARMYNEEHSVILEKKLQEKMTKDNFSNRRRLSRDINLNKQRVLPFNEFQKVNG